jgi:hypothetical protein
MHRAFAAAIRRTWFPHLDSADSEMGSQHQEGGEWCGGSARQLGAGSKHRPCRGAKTWLDVAGQNLKPWSAGIGRSAGIAVALACLVFAACTPPAPPTLPLQAEDFTLRGVPLTVDSAELRMTFGDPDTIVESRNPFADSVPMTTWVYQGFEVRFAGPASPVGYMILEPGERTARGLSVGDPARLMLELYGKPTTRFEPSWTYTDTTHPTALRVIDAVVQADTIRRIYLGWAIE